MLALPRRLLRSAGNLINLLVDLSAIALVWYLLFFDVLARKRSWTGLHGTSGQKLRRRYRSTSVGAWAAAAALKNGSWSRDWSEWLASHSGPARVPPPAIGVTEKGYPPIEDAPGSYVFQR